MRTRNWTAIAAFNRSAGPMRDRRAPRGGAGEGSARHDTCPGCGDMIARGETCCEVRA